MKEKISFYLLASWVFCFSFLQCTHEKANDDSLKPEHLIIGKWQLVEYSSQEGMIQIEDGEVIEFTSDGEVLFENTSAVYWFEADKLGIKESLTEEESVIIYTYEFIEDRLLLDLFSHTYPSENLNSLPNQLVYRRVKDILTIF